MFHGTTTFFVRPVSSDIIVRLITLGVCVTDDGNRIVQPVPVPGTLPYAYMDACRQVPWSAECTTCQTEVTSRAQAQQHISQEHSVIATCEQTPVRNKPSGRIDQ